MFQGVFLLVVLLTAGNAQLILFPDVVSWANLNVRGSIQVHQSPIPLPVGGKLRYLDSNATGSRLHVNLEVTNGGDSAEYDTWVFENENGTSVAALGPDGVCKEANIDPTKFVCKPWKDQGQVHLSGHLCDRWYRYCQAFGDNPMEPSATVTYLIFVEGTQPFLTIANSTQTDPGTGRTFVTTISLYSTKTGTKPPKESSFELPDNCAPLDNKKRNFLFSLF